MVRMAEIFPCKKGKNHFDKDKDRKTVENIAAAGMRKAAVPYDLSRA